jgi:hypothetical protein
MKIVSKPLINPIIHDDTTRMVVLCVIIVLCLISLYKIMRYYNGG